MTLMLAAPTPDQFEQVPCPLCGERSHTPLVDAEDDLTGKPGRFHFVCCTACGLAYQNPRIQAQHIGAYYDDEYIAHRKKTDWGLFTPLYEWAMGRHDRDKLALVQRFVALDAKARVLDVGCGAGTFLVHTQAQTGAAVAGVDFKDLGQLPWMKAIEFHHGLLHAQDFGSRRFDLVTMWHFLEHDYEPDRSLACTRDLLAPGGRLVVEVPRLDSLSYRLFRERWPGLQAPQHTTLYTRATLLRRVEQAGLRVVCYLPYGAFPPYFYLFTGVAFKLLKGRGQFGTAHRV